jgi:hypothetical protein
MKSLREVLTEESRQVVRAQNRPDIRDDRPRGVLFSTAGPTGWGRRRNLGDYKAGRSEHNFADQHDRFFDPAVDTLE